MKLQTEYFHLLLLSIRCLTREFAQIRARKLWIFDHTELKNFTIDIAWASDLMSFELLDDLAIITPYTTCGILTIAYDIV